MKVLIVEDKPAIADAVRRGLEGEGIAVDVMRDGVDGLWAATENAYDAIVLDLMLPGIGGRDVLVGLRERGVWTPVLVLTAREGDEVQAGAFDRGADDFLAKPFSFDILLARLRALVRRGAPERPVVLTAGDLRLEPARRRVTRHGAEIALTPREYGVLELLVRRTTGRQRARRAGQGRSGAVRLRAVRSGTSAEGGAAGHVRRARRRAAPHA